MVTIRVRTKSGMWRVPELTSQSKVARIQEWIEINHGIPVEEQVISKDATGIKKLKSQYSLSSQGLTHGDIVFLQYDGAIASNTTNRRVNVDGSISSVSYDERLSKTGFRPGLKSLRDMKMHWTIGEFVEMNSQFEFKIKRQEKAYCSKLSIDSASCNDFQSYLRQFAFQQSRCGWLYGKTEGTQVVVECIYEPPQHGTPTGFEVFEDQMGAKVEAIADGLGLQKVGWIFSHPPREDSTFLFSSREVMLAAQLQLDAGGKGTPFVTLKATIDKDGHASFEAFQVSDQCMEMLSAGALLENHKNPEKTLVHETFTALVESRPTLEIDNNFFLCVVPVVQHDSYLKCSFPKAHREGVERTRNTLREQLQRYSSEAYVKRISDFQVLIFLTDFLDINTDIPVICHTIASNDTLDSGYPVIINSVAGIQ